MSALGLNKHPDHNLIKVTKAFLIGYAISAAQLDIF